MEGIRFDGLSTGLQTSNLIAALIGFERRPLELIQSRQSQLESRQSLFRTLNTNLLNLSNAAKALDNQNSLISGPSLDEELLEFTTSSSDERFVTATATGNASPGSIDVRINALAQVGRQLSSGFATATEIVAQAGETLQIDFGGASPIGITIGAGGASLQDLRDLVNGDPNNGGQIRADVLFDGTTQRLVLAGTVTGATNDLTVTTNMSGSGGVGAFIDAALTQVASDAQIEVLGLPITRASNTINDLFGGVTLQLRAAHDAADPNARTTVEIARDDSAIEAKLQSLADTYNVVRRFAIDQSSFDETTKKAGLLSGDSTLRSIDRQLQTTLGNAYNFTNNPFSSLGQIGLRFDRDGMLAVDGKTLRAALDQDTTSVRELLSGDGTTDGAATALARTIENLTRAGDGTLAIRDQGFDDQIEALGLSIDRFEQRLGQREELLIERFARLETLVNRLQAQGGFLAAAFSNNRN